MMVIHILFYHFELQLLFVYNTIDCIRRSAWQQQHSGRVIESTIHNSATRCPELQIPLPSKKMLHYDHYDMWLTGCLSAKHAAKPKVRDFV
jgi:hypothetical protein